MQIKIKKLRENAVIPQHATEFSAGVDLHSCEVDCILPSDTVLMPTGLTVEIPVGHFGMIVPRSSLGHKFGIVLGNGTGIIDSDYRGEIMVSLHNRSHDLYKVNKGDRIAQLIIISYIKANFYETAYLSDTERGDGGFGSTGK